MNGRAFYRGIKFYKRRSSGTWSPSTPNLVVPRIENTLGNQPKLQPFNVFCSAFGVASILICANRQSDMEPLGKELILDDDKDARVMSHIDPTKMEDGETSIMTKTIKGAMVGLVPGILWGTLVVAAGAKPPVVLPGLPPALRIIGSRGLVWATTGGLWVGVKLLAEKYRMKKDVLSDAAGGFAAGAAFAGLRNRSIRMAIHGGVAFANLSVFIGLVQKTRSNQKSPSAN